MSHTKLHVILYCALALPAAAVNAESWQGVEIMPKSIGLALRAYGQAPRPVPGRSFVPGTAYDIEWPATVIRQEGQWLWIEDGGGHSTPAAAGWVSTEEVLKLEDSKQLQDCYTYYSEQLRTCNSCAAPWIHWLMGVYFEKRNETASAKKEYSEALSTSGFFSNTIPSDMSAWCNTPDVADNLRDLFEATVLYRLKTIVQAKTSTFVDLERELDRNQGILSSTAADEAPRNLLVRMITPAAKETLIKRFNGLKKELKKKPVDHDGDNFKKEAANLLSDKYKVASEAASRLFDPQVLQIPLMTPPPIDVSPYVFDSKIRLERLKAKGNGSSSEAESSAVEILLVIALGNQRAYAYVEAANALKTAYEHKSSENQETLIKDGDLLDQLKRHKGELQRCVDELTSSPDRVAKLVREIVKIGDALLEADIGEQALLQDARFKDSEEVDSTKLTNIIKTLAPKDLPTEPKDINGWAINVFPKTLETHLGDLRKQWKSVRAHLEMPNPGKGGGGDLAKELENVGASVSTLEADLDLVWAWRLRARAMSENKRGEFWISNNERRANEPGAPDHNSDDSSVGDEENLLACSDLFYGRAAYGAFHIGGNAGWDKACLLRAELRYDRLTDLLDDVTTLIAERADLRNERKRLGQQVHGGEDEAEDHNAESATSQSASWKPPRRTTAMWRAKTRAATALEIADTNQREEVKQRPSKVNDAWHASAGMLDREATALRTMGGVTRGKTDHDDAPAKPTVFSQAVELFSETIRRNPDLAASYRDCGTIYRLRAVFDPRPDAAEARAAIRKITRKLQLAHSHEATWAKQRQRTADAADEIATEYIKGINSKDGSAPKTPAKLLAEIKEFRTKIDDPAKSDDCQKLRETEHFRDLTAELWDQQHTLNADEDLMKAKELAQTACKKDIKDIGSMQLLAQVYADLGDYPQAEYYANRAAYYNFAGDQRPSLLKTREEYRRQIAPDHSNRFWKDALGDLEQPRPPERAPASK